MNPLRKELLRRLNYDLQYIFAAKAIAEGIDDPADAAFLARYGADIMEALAEVAEARRLRLEAEAKGEPWVYDHREHALDFLPDEPAEIEEEVDGYQAGEAAGGVTYPFPAEKNKFAITHDPSANAAYITLQEGEIDKTRQVAHSIYLDLDADGNVLGIELLDVLPPLLEKDGVVTPVEIDQALDALLANAEASRLKMAEWESLSNWRKHGRHAQRLLDESAAHLRANDAILRSLREHGGKDRPAHDSGTSE